MAAYPDNFKDIGYALYQIYLALTGGVQGSGVKKLFSLLSPATTVEQVSYADNKVIGGSFGLTLNALTYTTIWEMINFGLILNQDAAHTPNVFVYFSQTNPALADNVTWDCLDSMGYLQIDAGAWSANNAEGSIATVPNLGFTGAPQAVPNKIFCTIVSNGVNAMTIGTVISAIAGGEYQT